MTFLKNMFSGKSDVSSKRVIGTFILAGTAIVSWYIALTITESMKASIIISCFIAGGAMFGLTIFEKNQNNTGEKNPT